MVGKLLRRLIVAVIGLAIVIGISYLGGWLFFALVAILAVTALSEYYSALQIKGIRPNVLLGWTCSLLMLAAAQHGQYALAQAGYAVQSSLTDVHTLRATTDVFQETLLVLFICITATLVLQFGNREGQSAVVNSATTVFGVVYIGLLFSFILRLRYLDVPALMGDEMISEFTRRMGALVMGAAPVWLCDTTAYLVGGFFGKHKLCPAVSPNKTIEGSVAGLIAAVIGMLAVGTWLDLPLSHSITMGVVMGIVGQLGDLGKSVLKRDVDIKDFGSLLGPHGGILDRFDAVLFSMPLVYWYFWFFHP